MLCYAFTQLKIDFDPPGKTNKQQTEKNTQILLKKKKYHVFQVILEYYRIYFNALE